MYGYIYMLKAILVFLLAHYCLLWFLRLILYYYYAFQDV
jgi:hypothetical protein